MPPPPFSRSRTSSCALLALLVVVGGTLVDVGCANVADPRYLALGETVRDTFKNFIPAHNYLLEVPVSLQHDDILLTFEWSSGIPWFLLNCDEKPSFSTGELDATWSVRPSRRETSATLELANHQCFGSDKQLWLLVRDYRGVSDYAISFVTLGTRLTSLAMNFRPTLNDFAGTSLPASEAYFYKFEHPPSAANAVVASYELFGDFGNDIAGCSVEIAFYQLVTNDQGPAELSSMGLTPDKIPCRLLTRGRHRHQLGEPIQMSALGESAHLYLSVACTLPQSRPSRGPTIGFAFGEYNLAQTSYFAHKAVDQSLPSRIDARALRLADTSHQPFAVSFDYTMPKVLDLYDTNTLVHTLDGLVGAASWQYFAYTVVGPVSVEFRFFADGEDVKAYTRTTGIPTEDMHSARIHNSANELDACPFTLVHQSMTTVIFGVRGSTTTKTSTPFALSVSASHAKALPPFVVTPGSVKAGHWTYFHARLRRALRIQVPIRVLAARAGVELYVGVNEFPTMLSPRATDVRGFPGIKCVEMPHGAEGTLYVGIVADGACSSEGADVAGPGGSSDGAAVGFEVQLLLNGFADCNFHEE